MIGVVAPATQLAVAGSRTGRIGLLATPATVASGAYERAVRAADRHVQLESVACPDLAPIIQGGFPFDERVVDTVRGYCAPLREAEVDTVILGCTHYPLVAPMLQRIARAAGSRWSPPGRAWRAASSARWPRAGCSTRASARATTASCAPATPRRSARSARASCRCRSGEVEHVELADR